MTMYSLRTAVNEDEKEAYLDHMERDIKCYEAQNKTGNRILDTILTAKTIQCQNHGISLTYVADGKELEFENGMLKTTKDGWFELRILMVVG